MKKSALIITITALALSANEMNTAKDIIKKNDTSLQGIQKSIDNEDSKQNAILEEYSSLSTKLDNIKNENKDLKKRIELDKKKLLELAEEIKDVDKTKNAISSLMKSMLTTLEKMIKADTPFLLEKRLARVEKLKTALDNATLSNSQKYAKILAAYEIEYGYSNTISTYEEQIDGVTYNILRIGRVGLYYESLDKSDYGFWNVKTKKWQDLSSMKAKVNISKGIKIASKHENADILTLPFFTAKDVK